MITQKIIKLKKYLFLISIIFLFATFSHLMTSYLYDGSKSEPVKGGTITEGLIGNFPSLNPLKQLSGNNRYVVSLLYRSMLQYDLETGNIVGDLTSCDISNLKRIECYINDDAKWSNGEIINTNEIINTYNLIKENNTNIIISSLLEETIIEKNENTIIFKNDKEDVNFLNIFFQPIIPQKTIDNLSEENITGNFPTIDLLYSGNFVISNISSDLTIGVSKIILDKNIYNNKGNISKLILNIYPNLNTFLKNKQSVNIFNDNDFIVGDSIPRLASFKYTLPQFVGVFINQEKINNVNLRNFILSKINRENLMELLGEENFKLVNNPYSTKTSIEKEPENRNFDSIMNSLGYFKKSYIIEKYLPKKETKIISNEIVEEDIVIEESELSIDRFQQDSKYIYYPDYVDLYNFIKNDDILLQGNVTEDIDEIYINDYKLQNFSKGNSIFYYRLKESFSSIKEGLNEYKIYFVKDGKKELKEKITFLYYKDSNKLEEEKINLIKDLYKQESINNRKEEIVTIEEENQEKEEIDSELLEIINSLDENIYYDENFETFKLQLFYITSDKQLETTAFFIKNSIKELGIEIQLNPIQLTDISKILSDKSSYDLILTGVNLGYFDFNIFPYFHSSQSEGGYNFSNIKKSNLDLLLEDLKSSIIDKEKTSEIKEKINTILKDEQIIKTLYTPRINLLVDKNLNISKTYEKMPNKALRSYILDSSYIKEQKIINYEDKSIFGFFKYLIKIITGIMI